MDFAIIVDTSGSISRRNFRRLLRFIKSIVDSFEIGDELTHIALIEYSTQASVQLKFNDLTGGKLTSYNVERRVQGIPHSRGYTYIDKALRLANEQVFTYEAGMRDYVRKVNLENDVLFSQWHNHTRKKEILLLLSGVEPMTFRLLVRMLYHSVSYRRLMGAMP